MLELKELSTVFKKVLENDFDTRATGQYSTTKLCEWPALFNKEQD